MPHLVQVNDFSAPRILGWVFKPLLWKIHLLHFEQTNGFAYVIFSVKDLSHLEHANGFRPCVNPFMNIHLLPFSTALEVKVCQWKDFGLIVICFGTYSIMLILRWDLFHSFNIALWTYLTELPPCVNPFINLHSLFNLFKSLTSLKLLMKRFGVDYHLFWDLFRIINFTLGPIPQFHYFIVNLFHSPNNNLWPVAQFFWMTCQIWKKQKGYSWYR